MDSGEAALFLAEVAEDRKAVDVRVLDIRKITLVADYFIIASAPNTIRVRAIADAIQERAREKGIKLLHSEGYQVGRWILLDYGSVVVHVFHEDERKFYDLERLWGDAETVTPARRQIPKATASEPGMKSPT